MQVTDLNVLSLKPPASFPELYQELWWYSGSYASTTTTSSQSFLQKGATSTNTTTTASQIKLFTISASASATQKYAIEATMWSSSASGSTYLVLYDVTASQYVNASGVNSSATTATVMRGPQVTLTPGHTYAVSFSTNISSYTAYTCDVSLIIFPPAGSVSPSLSSISLANPSGGSLKEAYIPLWCQSSSSTNDTSVGTTSGSSFIQKGTQSMATSTSSSTVKLHTLSPNWNPSQKFALETSIDSYNTSTTTYLSLWDMTSNTNVSASTLSVSSATMTLIRSGSFTLTPGHSYGLSIYSTTSGLGYITKAHLVALT